MGEEEDGGGRSMMGKLRPGGGAVGSGAHWNRGRVVGRQVLGKMELSGKN